MKHRSRRDKEDKLKNLVQSMLRYKSEWNLMPE